MRDNLPEDLFADHAWQEMHKILDREMPERKRRGFLFWLLPMFGLCMVLGRDSLLDSRIPVQTEKPLHNSEAIAQSEEKKSPNAARQLEGKLEDHHPAKAGKQEVELPVELPVATNHSTANHSAKIQTRAFEAGLKDNKLPQEKHSGNQDLQQNLQAHTQIEQAREEQTNGLSSLAEPNAAKDKLDPNETAFESLGLIPGIAVHGFDKVAHENALEKVSINPRHDKQKWEYWVYAGTQAATGTQGLSGYQYGLQLGIPMGRFRLRTGPGFEQTEVGIQGVQRDAVTGKENFTDVKLATPDQPSLGVSSGSQGSQTVSTIHLQFLNWNLSLYRPLGKNWGIALGGDLQYLEAIKLGDRFLRSTLFDHAAERSYQLSNSTGNVLAPQASDLSKDSFRNFGFSAQAMLAYRISPRWSANLAYRQSLQNLSATDDLLLKPKWLNMGIQYRLK